MKNILISFRSFNSNEKEINNTASVLYNENFPETVTFVTPVYKLSFMQLRYLINEIEKRDLEDLNPAPVVMAVAIKESNNLPITTVIKKGGVMGFKSYVENAVNDLDKKGELTKDEQKTVKTAFEVINKLFGINKKS